MTTGTFSADPATNPKLVITLRGADGRQPLLTRETVRPADLSDVVTELHRDAWLRRGKLDATREDLICTLLPEFIDGSAPRCGGFVLEARSPSGHTARRSFTLRSLTHVATRAMARLTAENAIPERQSCGFELSFDPGLAAPQAPETLPLPPGARVRTARPHLLPQPLRPLLERSRAVAVPETDDEFPVLFTEAALASSERFARKGAALQGRVETGAVLAGHLATCPDSRECFLVVSEAFEVTDADQTTFSLAYTGKSWARIQTLLEMRQRTDPALAVRGQAHGHNWRPGEPCDGCLKQPICSLTNVFVSEEDQTWTRAVFAHDPFRLCHIFGFSARGDALDGLFSLRDGRLQKRGYFVLPGFNP